MVFSEFAASSGVLPVSASPLLDSHSWLSPENIAGVESVLPAPPPPARLNLSLWLSTVLDTDSVGRDRSAASLHVHTGLMLEITDGSVSPDWSTQLRMDFVTPDWPAPPSK